MNRIAVITGCWRRAEVVEACVRSWQALGAVEVVAAYTPGDAKAKAVLDACGARTVEAPNRLAIKFNAATLAAKEVYVDYFLHMGSDDLVCSKLWAAYQTYTGKHMALTDWYFHNLPTNETRYWPGYAGPRAGEPIGAGKLIRRDVMERIKWKPFTDSRDGALDFDQHHKLVAADAPPDCFRLKDLDAVGVDLKGPDNATPWKRILPLTEPCQDLSELDATIWGQMKHL